MRALILVTLMLISCGKNSSSGTDSTISRDERVATESYPDIDPADVKKISDLLPTTYYIAKEASTSCTGLYRGVNYKGSEKTAIKDLQGQTIVTVCTRFYRVLLMEGSAILKDRGEGEFSLNYGGKVNGEYRFYVLDHCKYGEGTRRGLCLLPYYTLAADNKVHQIGDILFVPKAVGLLLPDGTTHEGFFVVRDTGGAFVGIGGKRVDMFTGTENDSSNVFQRAGFHHKNPMEAYKITGESAEIINEKLRQKFPELF